jgi:hypothetical protein
MSRNAPAAPPLFIPVLILGYLPACTPQRCDTSLCTVPGTPLFNHLRNKTSDMQNNDIKQ